MSNVTTVKTSLVRGCEALPISVEVSVEPGLPGFHIVGMVDAAALEGRERVKCAIKSAGFEYPGNAKVLANITPSHIRKQGSSFDLPIAVGILVATGQVSKRFLECSYFGELSLCGDVLATRGALCHAVSCMKTETPCVLAASSTEVPAGLGARGLRNLSDLRDALLSDIGCTGTCADSQIDFADIAGHEAEKRACQVAAAGMLPIMFMGPAGVKTMIARRIPTIMPALDDETRMETACAHSAAGLDATGVLGGQVPFRAPHHSATLAGLIGGGSPVIPGEVALANGGVLFLDRIEEFASRQLQALRQPLAEGAAVITRADGSYRMPARFLLAGAANPCPCGQFGSPEGDCTCPEHAISSFQDKLGGPLEFPLWIHVDGSLSIAESATTSANLKVGVLAAREYCEWRRNRGDSEESTAALLASCRMDEQSRSMLENVGRKAAISGAGIAKVLKTARTIADLERSYCVETQHVCEALSYRR